ncbi:hypothetical protein [Akkermansia massiliensis]|uniref:hypothetical protein n=1 Tax=Akkermansia massiliensis TaxID=2927224 RepID=UPI00211E0A40|nr:hypothetical protein [Akkermansia massiliensis]
MINSTPGRTLTVGLTWYDGANSSTLASAYSPYFYYQSNGPQQVSTLVESVWRDGSTRTATGYDIYIQCNTSHLNSLYYEVALPAEHTGKYDFQSILTHEIGHAAGFLSLATQTGTFQVQSGNASAAYSTMLYTRYDSLLTNQEGQSIVNKAGNGNTAFTLGETLSLGDTGLTAYNPATWQQGSSMAHIDSASDPDALMQYSISPDTYHRTLTDGEMGIDAFHGLEDGSGARHLHAFPAGAGRARFTKTPLLTVSSPGFSFHVGQTAVSFSRQGVDW